MQFDVWQGLLLTCIVTVAVSIWAARPKRVVYQPPVKHTMSFTRTQMRHPVLAGTSFVLAGLSFFSLLFWFMR